MSCNERKIRTLGHSVGSGTLAATSEENGRKASELSQSLQASDLVGSSRRPRRTRPPRPSPAEGLDRRMKRVYPKVRTGCDTCKQRKIKCDETRPECRNCIKSGRACLGYHPPQAKIFEPGMARSDSDLAYEAKATEYFKNETAIRLASYRPLRLSLDFWQNVVPGLAIDNAPIRHAMLTLSATQEEYESGTPDSLSTEWSMSLRQHTRAVRELWSGIAAASIPNEATLICCLMLTLYDIWHFGIPLSFTDVFGKFQHVFGGLKVCKFIKKTSPSKSPLPEMRTIDGAEMIPAFRHLADCASVMLDDVDDEQSRLLQEFSLGLNPVVPGQIAQADEAIDMMDTVLRQIAKFEPGVTGTDFDRIESHLTLILQTLQQSLSAAQQRNDHMAIADLRTLRVHHRAAIILLDGMSADSEVLYDKYRIDFAFIVAELEDLLREGSAIPHRRVCIGVIPPLFLTATKCRDSFIRGRALAALHVLPHHEHLWTSCTAQQIAQQTIWLEQGGGSARIRLQSIKFDSAQGQVELRYDSQEPRNRTLDTMTFSWESGAGIQPSQPAESFSMPRRMLQVCGYSAPILSSREIACHCSTTAHIASR